jgi:stage II sporulation protein D
MYGILMDVTVDGKSKYKMEIDDVLIYGLSGLNLFNYHIEVLKAMAVLKRSELIKRVKNSSYYVPYHHDVEITKENYEGLDEDKKKLLKMAIDETRGIIVTSGGKAVDLFFTSCCGGGTSNSEGIMGYKINYLRKVLCRHCRDKIVERSFKINDIAKKINANKSSYKEEIDGVFNDILRDDTGRILRINFLGREMTGEEFAKLFEIDSNRIYFLEDSIVFKIIGEGLGLGICLDGANKLAGDGLNYKDIINYYYTGVEFESLNNKAISRLLANKKFVIDPGHGGKDKGNTCGEINEKDVNLTIALRLEKMLKDLGADVTLVRNEDIDVPLGERVKLINKIRPEFCISIHQNSFMTPGVNGVEAYCYDKDGEAIKLGKIICENISREIGVKNRGVKTGDYYLLRESRVSTLILECMYMTGSIDSTKYREENYPTISRCIFEGICQYYDVKP